MLREPETDRSLTDLLADIGIRHEAIPNGNGNRRLIAIAADAPLGAYDAPRGFELWRQAHAAG